MSCVAQVVSKYAAPYQPTSSRAWNWSVILGIAVAIIVLSFILGYQLMCQENILMPVTLATDNTSHTYQSHAKDGETQGNRQQFQFPWCGIFHFFLLRGTLRGWLLCRHVLGRFFIFQRRLYCRCCFFLHGRVGVASQEEGGGVCFWIPENFTVKRMDWIQEIGEREFLTQTARQDLIKPNPWYGFGVFRATKADEFNPLGWFVDLFFVCQNRTQVSGTAIFISREKGILYIVYRLHVLP